MVEDAMAHDEAAGAPENRGRGRRRPPTIEGVASDLSKPEPSPVSDIPASTAPIIEVAPATEPAPEPGPVTSNADESVEQSKPPVETPADESTPQHTSTAPVDTSGTKTSFFPLVVAALVGGVVAAGGVTLLYGASSNDASVKALEARLAAAEQKVAAANTGLLAVKDELGRISGEAKRAASSTSGTANPPIDLAPVQARLTALEAAVSDIRGKAETGLSRAESAESKAANLTQQTDGKIAALSQQIGEAGGKVSALAAQQAKDNSAPILAVISALRVALDRGQPFATEIGALKGLGVPGEKLAGLQEVAAKGVPPSQQLAAQFRAIAAHFADAPVTVGSDSMTQRLWSSAASLVKVRPVGAVAGDDVVAVSSRVEGALARGDADQAAAEAMKLPPAAREQAKSVIEAIKTRQTAANALARLEQETFAAIAAQAAQR